MEIISRYKARKEGLKRFFTGKPCIYGNIEERYTGTGKCLCRQCRDDFNANKNRLRAIREGRLTVSQEELDRIKNRKPSLNSSTFKEICFSPRKEAKRKKEKYYFTDEPCINGHIPRRFTSTGACVECHRENVKNYRNKNKAKVNALTLKAIKKWQKNNPQLHTVESRMRASIRGLIKRGKIKSKENSMSRRIGIRSKDFVSYIENQFPEGMTWNNRKDWQIDHIRPCNSFDLLDERQVKVCFNYRNLRPLWSTQNNSKGSSYTPINETEWVERMISLGYEGELFLKYEEGNSY